MNAVVDDRLRVHGIERLRVVDASVMPAVTSTNTNAPTIMIAEKGAAMVREEASALAARPRNAGGVEPKTRSDHRRDVFLGAACVALQYVKEAADFAVALLDARRGFRLSAFGYLRLPDRHRVQGTIDAVPHLAPGDIIITNDPYTSGLSTHLPDLHLIQPYFAGDRRLGLVVRALLRHRRRLPGSVSPALTSIFRKACASRR